MNEHLTHYCDLDLENFLVYEQVTDTSLTDQIICLTFSINYYFLVQR